MKNSRICIVKIKPQSLPMPKKIFACYRFVFSISTTSELNLPGASYEPSGVKVNSNQVLTSERKKNKHLTINALSNAAIEPLFKSGAIKQSTRTFCWALRTRKPLSTVYHPPRLHHIFQRTRYKCKRSDLLSASQLPFVSSRKTSNSLL